MDAKLKFREGWVMLNRPFKFAELSKPLQKMTVIYAYSEKPIIEMKLNKKGLELMKEYDENYGKPMSLLGGSSFRKLHNESDDLYEARMERIHDYILRTFSTQENYKGEIVQCYVEGIPCRIYPDEYNIISKETFDHLLTCDENEYQVEIENEIMFDTKEIKQKIFYLRNRGIGKEMAIKMNCAEMKDSVIFRPQQAVLDMFCREHEIY